MRLCDAELTRAARSPATVLLRGESGVGKELAEHAIHDRSKYKDGTQMLAADVRFVAATHRNLERAGGRRKVS